MNSFESLLALGAREARRFIHESPDAKLFGEVWLESIALRIESASKLRDGGEASKEIRSIARSLIDSGPAAASFAPSFLAALDAVQRADKHHR
jgi:hypothetical protein